MAEAESEESVRLRDRNKASEMPKSPSSIGLPSSKEHKSSPFVTKGSATMLDADPKSSYSLTKSLPKMVNVGLESSYFVKKSLAKMVDEGPKSSYFVKKSLAEMVDEDPIRLQNQSCAIRKETVQTEYGERLVYSSLARLPTFSICLSSTWDEEPSRDPLRESSVDPKDQSPFRYFQMPELGARVFVGNVDGFDTITCHLLNEWYHASKSDLDSEFAAVRSVYKGDFCGELSRLMRAQYEEFRRSEPIYFDAILSGTELFSASTFNASLVVGNLGGQSSRVSGSSSDYKDCGGDETIRQPSDVVEQPGDRVPGVRSLESGHWRTNEGPRLFRLPKGSYLRKPEFVKPDDPNLESYDRSERHVLQLTRFDDFIVLGDRFIFNSVFRPDEVLDIVRKNASETADVIAAQLVKGAIEKQSFWVGPITFIVIFLDHKEILQKGKENMDPKDTTILLGLSGLKASSQSIVLRDDKEIAESKEEEKITTLKEEEKVFASKMEDKKGIMIEEDHKVKILVGEPLPNVPQISIASLEENELGMKSSSISSKLTSVEVQDNSKASSSTILIEDDDFKNITKWIIYGDMQEKTLLCFFNVEENKYEFYFEDHESMAIIVGLGVPHSKVVLEYGSPHMIVVEIPKDDWDVVWANSNVIPLSIPKGQVLKQELFPNILYCIASIINTDNVVSEANDGGVGGNNGKDTFQGNANNGKDKDKVHDHDNQGGNIGHPGGGSNGIPDDNANKERKGKDRNDDKKDDCDQDDRKASNGGKKVQAIVYLYLWPGGVLKEKGKKMELVEVHEEEGEEKKKELEEVHEGVEKKKNLPTLWQALKRSKNGNVIGNQQKSATTSGIKNDDDGSLQKQLEEQIHGQMVFTFTIEDEVGGQLKTIQATIKPITFQFPSGNKKNYLQRRRFGWFHKKLKVAFGVFNPIVAYLDPMSCKVLDSSEVEETSSQGTSNENSKTSTNVYKGKMGLKQGVIASGEYNRISGSENKTTNEVQNSCKTNRRVTKGDFSISNRINLNAQQLKYSYRPRSPFKEKEFEEMGEDDRLNMYHLNPICQSQQVSCEGTWQAYGSRNLEAYKLEASRELGMTRIYNSKLETLEEKKQKGVWKVEKNLPLCFIQKLEKVVYLNHSMSHLTCSTIGVYRLREIDVQNNPSTFHTQGQCIEEPKWLGKDPLVDVKQEKNI